MRDDIERVLIDQEVIRGRLDQLAERIEGDYAEGGELVVIALLNGAMMFMADLLRRIKSPLTIECLRVSSYVGGTKSSGRVEFLDKRLPDLRGAKVLVLDDILDSGRTLKAVGDWVVESGASEVRSCVLLEKQCERAVEFECDYVGFKIGDEFVVGYGLDYRERYRNLPFVGVLKAEAILPEHR